MKRFLIFDVVVLSWSYAFPQAVPVKHQDKVYAYEVGIPSWWTIRETPPNFFGGTFQTVGSTESALIFKCYTKKEFKSLLDFENWVVRGYKAGDSPKWQTESMLLEITPSSEFKIGNGWIVHKLDPDGGIYDNFFLVTQTSTSYIWISLTATPSTYSPSFNKFKEIINTFKAL